MDIKTLIRHILLFACIAKGCTSCRDGWVNFESTCYLFSHSISSWGEAAATCTALHSHLAVIPTDKEHNFLIAELTKLHPSDATRVQYWIDGSDLEIENEWRWTTSGDQLINISWAVGEPNNAQRGNCLNLWGKHGFLLADDNCERHLYYICQSNDNSETGILIG